MYHYFDLVISKFCISKVGKFCSYVPWNCLTFGTYIIMSIDLVPFNTDLCDKRLKFGD